MTHPTPIPPDVFADAVARLDESELAAFVGALQRGTGGDVAVEIDPPYVTVGSDDTRTTVLVAGASGEPDRPTDADRIVRPVEDDADAADPSILTLSDLREQLLYGLAPEEAEAVCEEFLGTAARSVSYASEIAESTGPQRTVGAKTDDSRPGAGASGGRQTPSSQSKGSKRESTSTGPSGRDADEGSDSRRHPTTATRLSNAVSTRRAVVVALVLLVAAGGVASVADRPLGDAAGLLSGSAGDGGESLTGPEGEVTGAAPATGTATTEEPGTSTGAGMEAEVLDDGTNGSEAGVQDGISERERHFRPEPTCTRSFLLVTQIQMNALRYNDNETDAGIRTVRRFASPTNRRAVESFSEYAEVIRSPTYAAMLTYESVQYDPVRTGERTAQVRVVTRENDTVTGRYAFFLRKVGDGEYDGCWMTDAVLTQSTVVLDADPVASEESIGA
ncbi:hypothetical protein [Halobellus rubicundus]|uniref:DUF4864 domain-containing protein n=1 Tax=Halobellus rubicundus TaxID=2996466 RepID=A0ABD5MJ34_9EURY